MTRHNCGLAALVASTVLWVGVFVVPFFDGPVGTKAAVAGSLYGVSTAFFLLAGWLLGPETMAQMKAWMRQRVAARRGRSSRGGPTPQ